MRLLATKGKKKQSFLHCNFCIDSIAIDLQSFDMYDLPLQTDGVARSEPGSLPLERLRFQDTTACCRVPYLKRVDILLELGAFRAGTPDSVNVSACLLMIEPLVKQDVLLLSEWICNLFVPVNATT